MADHVYELIINFNGRQNGDGYKSPKKKKQENEIENGSVFETLGDEIANSIFSFAEKGVNAFTGIATIATIEEVGREIYSNYIQRIDRFTGSRQAQDIANASLSIAGKVFHPISSYVNYMFESEQSRYDKGWESIGLNLYRERGGMSLNRSRNET